MKRHLDKIALVALVAVASCVTALDFKGPGPGETCFVSMESLTVRQASDEFSPAVMTLAYKDAVAVEKDVRVAPPSRPMVN